MLIHVLHVLGRLLSLLHSPPGLDAIERVLIRVRKEGTAGMGQGYKVESPLSAKAPSAPFAADGAAKN